MIIFLLIILLFTPVIAIHKINSNVYFKLIGEHRNSTVSVVYKLYIKDHTDFLEFIDKNFETYLIDSFSNKTDQLLERHLVFYRTDVPDVRNYVLKNLLLDDKSKTVFKFNFGRFLYKLSKFCVSSTKCRGKITLVNFKNMNGWNSREMQKKIKIYSQIDAYLTICGRRNDDHLESCADGLKIEKYVNQYCLFMVFLMVIVMVVTVIVIDLYEFYYK